VSLRRGKARHGNCENDRDIDRTIGDAQNRKLEQTLTDPSLLRSRTLWETVGHNIWLKFIKPIEND
jgi:hypothetical protein